MSKIYLTGDEEDRFFRHANKLFLLQGRYQIEVQSVSAGNLVLMEGFVKQSRKTATITSVASSGLEYGDFSSFDIFLSTLYYNCS